MAKIMVLAHLGDVYLIFYLVNRTFFLFYSRIFCFHKPNKTVKPKPKIPQLSKSKNCYGKKCYSKNLKKNLLQCWNLKLL